MALARISSPRDPASILGPRKGWELKLWGSLVQPQRKPPHPAPQCAFSELGTLDGTSSPGYYDSACAEPPGAPCDSTIKQPPAAANGCLEQGSA